MGPGSAGTSRENKKKKKIPKVEEFLQNRDFTGAKTLLEVYKFILDYYHNFESPIALRGHVHIHAAMRNVELLMFSSVPTHPPEITSTVAVIFYVSIRLVLYYHALYIIFSHLVFIKNIATQ
jgi:hypothetical protein